MMIRLSITGDSGAPTTFEHPGPVVRIGRDLFCDLVLQGAADDVASRRHARIDLAAHRATITDVGSSNGTLLNGGVLQGPAPLRVGDQIQMGFTGATLTVLALDLGPPPARKLGRPPRLVLIGVVAAAVIAVVVGVIAVKKYASAARAGSATAPSTVPTVRARPPSTDRGERPPDEHAHGGTGKPEEKPVDDAIDGSIPVPDVPEPVKEPPSPAKGAPLTILSEKGGPH
jgi:pSer/pThr/pTyr-binding forkhead associated (FHA) protein